MARISFQAMNLNKSPAVPSGGWEQDFSASLDVLEGSTQNYIPSDEIRNFNPIPSWKNDRKTPTQMS